MFIEALARLNYYIKVCSYLYSIIIIRIIIIIIITIIL